MPVVEALSEVVVFELRGSNGGDGLWERLRPRWFGGIYECDETTLVVVELRPEEGDLSALLRAVQFWVSGSGNGPIRLDRKSTRLNSSHTVISYAVFCL